MTPSHVLAALFGACAASGWWAWARFGSTATEGGQVSLVLMVCLSVMAVAWFVVSMWEG